MDIRADIQAEALSLGFSISGVTKPAPPPHIAAYRRWIEHGYHGTMEYLANGQAVEKRSDPKKILAETRSMLVVGIRYPNPEDAPVVTNSSSHGRVAAYAWGDDYHELLPPRLEHLAGRLNEILQRPIHRKVYTDTGPILERDYAQQAGLGWAGKNTCLIVPQQGSYFFLGELMSDAELEADLPFTADLCGSCTRCIDACPTSCIKDDRTIDASRCISYLTIENKGAVPVELREKTGEWIFGCDICQQVCPWNIRFADPSTEPAFEARPNVARPTLANELLLTPEAFNRKFRSSPVRRAKRRGYLRNVAVAAGNSNDRDLVPILIQVLLTEPEPLVRLHAAWALGQLGGKQAVTALDKALRSEPEEIVRIEIMQALERGRGSNL